MAWAAAAVLVTPAAQALDVFTGNTPVYVGSWFNGTVTEVQQFQFALDWQGWCNARVGAVCTNHRYWSVAGNWDNNGVPGLSSDVRVMAGDTVRVGDFSSLYLGPISGTVFAGTLSAAGRVELYGSLTVGNAAFADLHNDRDNQGTLTTSGLTTVSLLSSGAGRFRGQGGTTVVQAFTPSPVRNLFEPLVGSGHTFQFAGNSVGTGVAVALEPMARFINSGTLDLGGGSVGLQGTATFAQLPVFVNQGQLQGSGTVSGVKFDNLGTVLVGTGQAMALGNWGEHTGSFIGQAGSTMSFAGIGSAGHSLAAGSQVNSQGAVNFGVGNHRVLGGFNAASVTSTAGGSLVFEGPRPVIGSFTLGGGGTAALRNAAGASIQELTIDGDFTRLDVQTGTPLELQRLRLVGGSFNARAPVSIASNVAWSSGWLINTEPTTVAGDWQLLPGTRGFRANVGNSGNVSWTGGNFSEWSGRFTHQAGQQFDIWGDFNSAGGVGGKLVNSGTVTKRSGAGRSELAMTFDTIGGTVRALSGTLALSGGGTHTDATFAASTGAAIELAGGTTFGGHISINGLLNVTGGDFTLLDGTSYLHTPGSRFDVANIKVNAGAHLSLVDALRTTGSVTNLGTFTPSSHVLIFGDFVQQGSFGLNPGKNLYVQGSFSNHQPLTVSDADFTVGTLVNHARLDLIGATRFHANTLDNRGTLVLGPANGFPGVSAFIASGSNSGSLRVDGAMVSVSSNNFQNTGQISNEGTWYASSRFTQNHGGRFDNSGSLILSGETFLVNGGSINNGGVLTLEDGLLQVGAGSQITGAGSFSQLAGLTQVDGHLQADGGISIDGGTLRGTGTVEGTVTVGPAGQWKPGNSPGTMTVLGDADLGGGLEIEVATSTLHDRLVIRDNFTVRGGAAISFVFGPGYVPRDLDGDSIAWLSAAGTNFAPGSNASFSGLPSQWSATLSPDGRQVKLSNDLAVQIPLRGSHAIVAGEVRFNALDSQTANYPLLDRLDNAGFFNNRAGASAYAAELNNAAGATLVNRGELGAQALNNAGQLNNRSDGTLQVARLHNSGTLVNEGSLLVVNDLTNAEGGLLEQRGSMQVQGQVDNRGSLVVAGPMNFSFAFNSSGDIHIQPGGSVTGGPGSYFWHASGELRVDGLLEASDVTLFAGHLSGNGQIRGALTTFAPVGPGNSVGLLTVDGSLNARTVVDLEIASASDFDRLVVTGDATLEGSVSMYLLGSYRPTLGDSFSFLSVGGALQITHPDHWVVLRLVSAADPDSGWTPWADSGGIYDPNVPSQWRAVFNQAGLSITAVPEPGAWSLMLAGLGAVAWLARRRQAAAPGAGAA